MYSSSSDLIDLPAWAAVAGHCGLLLRCIQDVSKNDHSVTMNVFYFNQMVEAEQREPLSTGSDARTSLSTHRINFVSQSNFFFTYSQLLNIHLFIANLNDSESELFHTVFIGLELSFMFRRVIRRFYIYLMLLLNIQSELNLENLKYLNSWLVNDFATVD